MFTCENEHKNGFVCDYISASVDKRVSLHCDWHICVGIGGFVTNTYVMCSVLGNINHKCMFIDLRVCFVTCL